MYGLCIFIYAFFHLLSLDIHAKVIQSCPTLCDPMDCRLPGFSVHGILQARILEWVAYPFSRGYSQPRNQTLVSHIAGRYFTGRNINNLRCADDITIMVGSEEEQKSLLMKVKGESENLV